MKQDGPVSSQSVSVQVVVVVVVVVVGLPGTRPHIPHYHGPTVPQYHSTTEETSCCHLVSVSVFVISLCLSLC